MDNDGIIETSSEILQEKHYYPFGMEIEGPWMQSGANNPYQYNGKELHTEFGLNLMDYGARWYDAAVGRWWSVDLMADVLEEWSPYVYVYNNPISFNDPTGMIGELASTFVGPNGKVLEERDDGDSNVYFVSNPASWDGTKKGLPVIGLESQFRKTNDGGYEYNFGQQAIEGNYFIETLFIPLPFVNRYGGYVVRKLKQGGKWIIEVIEKGTQRIIGKKVVTKSVAETTEIAVKILERDGDVIILQGKVGTETIEGIANFNVSDGILYLNKMHVQGSSAGKVGRANMRKMIEALGKQFNVNTVIVQGGKRTTGKYKGKTPSPWIYKVPK